MKATNHDSIHIGENRLPINTSNGKHACYIPILEALHQQLSAMISFHNKVLVVRFDLHLSNPISSNIEISRLIEKIRKHLHTKYKCKRFGYLWVREQEKSKKQHYHLAIILDANKIRYPSALLAWIRERWETRGHPQPFIPKNCFYLIPRDDKEALASAYTRCSYLAKTRGKGYGRKSTKNYSSSRLTGKASSN